MDVRIIPPTAPLRGTVRVPGDKSISHRVVLFAAMAEGSSRLTGVLDSADVRSTIAAVREIGASVDVKDARPGGLDLIVDGWGPELARSAGETLDCGNSGTTARLLMGVLAAAPGEATLRGDASLSARPMERVARPLELMGASVTLTGQGTLPAVVRGGELRAIRYELPVASAQVKSAVLLAGLAAGGRTVVVEPVPSRDHTERLLPAFGVGVGRSHEERACWVDGPAHLAARDMDVPADPSSAAFLVAAAVLTGGSELQLPGVVLNETRTGFLRLMRTMGADVTVTATGATGAEAVGTLRAAHGQGLSGVTVLAAEAPSLIDEVPVLAVVATQASGSTRFEGIGELRVKESDRLTAVEYGLRALGATVTSGPDWLQIEGPCALRGAQLDSLGDHRLAMAWAVAALVADSPVTIAGWDAVGVSYPAFAADLETLAGAPVVLSC